jgi:hypothetical protein
MQGYFASKSRSWRWDWERDVSGVRPFEQSAYLLVCSPVRKAVLSRIQADLFCRPKILKALCLNIFVPGIFRVPMEEIVDRHLFLVEMM